MPSSDYIQSLIDKWDRRDWTALPSQFEADAVRKAYADIKHLFGRRIAHRIAASKADTFSSLRKIALDSVQQ